MKGIVINSFINFIEDEFDIKTLNLILENRSNLYFNMNTYDDKDLVLFVNDLGFHTGKSVENIEFEFGKYFFNVLLKNYKEYFLKADLYDFLVHLERYIHPEVERNISGSITPSFTIYGEKSDFELHYQSLRKMHHFAHGLLQKAINYFDGQYEIKEFKIESEKTIFYLVNNEG